MSCQDFVKNTNTYEYNELISNYKNASEVHLVFSHNISGETHPCGCRHFPLGGLPQFAGKLHEIKSKYPTIYIDTGDTLFPNANIPKSMEKSLSFSAQNLNKALNKLDLKLFTPGDQDLAKGLDYLARLQKESNYLFLISNFNKNIKLTHKKWIKTKIANLELYFIGVLDPDAVLPRDRGLLTDPVTSIQAALKEIGDSRSKNSRIILLSHSGMEKDKLFAKKFKQIDWIIGAHTQSFTRHSVDEGNTKIVQVLSRNHYMGDISINLSDKKKDGFKIHEMRSDQAKKLPKNPFDKFITDHKSKLQEIQKKEQDELSVKSDPKEKVKPPTSCLECHTDQYKHWQTTAHSLAYVTLHNINEQNNPECIGCHSVNFMKPSGFYKTQNAIILKDEKKKEAYFKEFSKIFSKVKSVRELKSSKVTDYAKLRDKLDKKFEVKHNFSNVQCLNCHDKSNQHPFEIDEKEKPKKDWVTTCTKCHTTDQAPNWYKKDDKGLARDLDKDKFKKNLKSMSCPKKKE